MNIHHKLRIEEFLKDLLHQEGIHNKQYYMNTLNNILTEILSEDETGLIDLYKSLNDHLH